VSALRFKPTPLCAPADPDPRENFYVILVGPSPIPNLNGISLTNDMAKAVPFLSVTAELSRRRASTFSGTMRNPYGMLTIA
jgi:hypothetical protein